MYKRQILRGTAEQTHPDVILAVDALAACSIHRLNCTIQLADTGIWPGSGVGNHRNALNQETLGVPVIGIGVPTVVGAGTIVHDAVAGVLESLEESEMDEFLGEVISPALESLYVTTKEIDEMVRRQVCIRDSTCNAWTNPAQHWCRSRMNQKKERIRN